MKKIIALAGTQGTGKTTTAYEICTALKKAGINTVVLDEKARECPFPINTGCVDETQIWLIISHIKKELELMIAYDIVVSDRSVLDPYIYGSVISKGTCIYKSLLPYCIDHIDKYYKHLYIMDPSYFNYCVDDGVRSTDMEFRSAVNSEFIKVCTKYKIDFNIITNADKLITSVLNENTAN